MTLPSNRPAVAPARGPHAPLAAALQLVETRLAERIESREPLLTDIARYLIDSGGKRVRPAVTLLVFFACGGDDLKDIVDVAAALELIHSASLLHDDIIDRSDIRRGKTSALKQFGLGNTLVAGDFIFSRAFQLCARFDEQLIDWAAQACISLTEGETMQGRFRHNGRVTPEDYLEIISRKTASIFEQGARTAAHLAGAGADVVAAMARCGYSVGMTFQIVDDLLDVIGDKRRTGKPTGIDLREGSPSLPVVLALESDPVVAAVFEDERPSVDAVENALQRIRQSGILARVRQLAAQHGTEACACLAALESSPDKEQLLTLIEELLQRLE